MKPTFIFIKVFLIAVIFGISTTNAIAQHYYSGPYTDSGISYSYNLGTYSSTGVKSLHQVEICGDQLTVDGNIYQQWKTDGQWLWYGHNCNSSNHPEYLYNTSTGELRWRFIWKFFGLNISDHFWFLGDQSSYSSGGGGSSYYGGGGSQYNSSSTQIQEKCPACLGNGKCSGYNTGMNHKYYCKGSGRCANCYGSGSISNSYSQGRVLCTFCGGNGRCSNCHGSGTCSRCGGSAHK